MWCRVGPLACQGMQTVLIILGGSALVVYLGAPAWCRWRDRADRDPGDASRAVSAAVVLIFGVVVGVLRVLEVPLDDTVMSLGLCGTLAAAGILFGHSVVAKVRNGRAAWRRTGELAGPGVYVARYWWPREVVVAAWGGVFVALVVALYLGLEVWPHLVSAGAMVAILVGLLGYVVAGSLYVGVIREVRHARDIERERRSLDDPGRADRP